MFKKPSRNFRQRKRHEDESDEEPSGKTEIETVAASENEPQGLTEIEADIKPDIKIKAPLSRLTINFDGDEEEDEFKVKKSSYSRRVAKQLEKEKKKREKEIQEKEREAQKLAEECQKQKDEELEIIWLNSESSKKAQNNKEAIVEVIEIPEGDHFSDDDEEDERPQFRSSLERGYIPDAKTIFALKKKREMARNIDDFIALTTATGSGSHETGNSRQDDPCDEAKDRRDDDEDDDEFEDGRIEFSLDKETLEKEEVRQAFLDAQHEDHSGDVQEMDSEDEEHYRWETEQIKKGFGISNTEKLKEKIDYELSSQMVIEEIDLTTPLSAKRTASFIPAHLNEPFDPNHVTIESILDNLNEMMKEKNEKIDHLERQLVSIGVHTEMTEDEIEQLETRRDQLLKQQVKEDGAAKTSSDQNNHADQHE